MTILPKSLYPAFRFSLLVLLLSSYSSSAQQHVNTIIHDDIYLSTYISPVELNHPSANVFMTEWFLSSGQSQVLFWSDEFDDDQLDVSRWNAEHYYQKGLVNFDGQAPGEIQFLSEENVELHDGTMQIIAREFNEERLVDTSVPESSNIHDGEPNRRFYRYSSGMVVSRDEFLYGTFEARIRLPFLKDLWPAFWMFGGSQSKVPELDFADRRCEIDIFEFFGSNGKKMVSTIHYWTFLQGRHANYYDGNSYKASNFHFENTWHTYGMKWDQYTLSFTLDGQPLPGTHYHFYAMEEGTWPRASFDGNLNLTEQHWGIPLKDGNELMKFAKAGYSIYVNRLFPDQPMPVIIGMAIKQSSNPPLHYNEENKFSIVHTGTVFPQAMEVDWIRISKPLTYDTLFTVASLLNESEGTMKVYPSVFSSTLNIVTGNSTVPAQFELFDNLGKLVMKRQFMSTIELIETSALPSGFYVLKVSTSERSKTFKLIKQ